jgi:hypothetical protein
MSIGGSGKSYVINALVKLFKRCGASEQMLLSAPTGILRDIKYEVHEHGNQYAVCPYVHILGSRLQAPRLGI